ncbi:short chain dehydrogenase [Pseudomonas azadiae]|uniref:Short chain dehydrogenase n=1 Tax=Pseudomonas azadiae TaxID=2843612 RepID=A0ABS6P5H2_9PSED|nr:short chain dehydrogenase [Pseudomonas azadiae]NMF38923.1 short chain dehydrogenase [Pseudomonas sp. SWRI 103]
MIDPATGMRPGERYTVDSLERTRNFSGFFLDGKYYLGPELLTAVGWLEGQTFIYDELDATGEPVFPDRVAGTIEDLTLILGDGARLKLHQMPVHVNEETPESAPSAHERGAAAGTSSGSPFPKEHGEPRVDGGQGTTRHTPYWLIAAGAILLLGGLTVARNYRLNNKRHT